MTARYIYKITPASAWRDAEKLGVFTGAPIDLADGFIHFSTAEQACETAQKHFSGQEDLLLVAVDTAQFGDELKWEVSRNDDLFPHLYAELETQKILWAKPMPLGDDGNHIMPKFED